MPVLKFGWTGISRHSAMELDTDLLKIQVNIPAAIGDQGAVAVNAYLATLSGAKEGQSSLQKLNLVRAIFIGNGAAGKTSLIPSLGSNRISKGRKK